MAKGQIIITGGSKGIGLAITKDLIARGFEVASISRTGKGPVGVHYACDMTDEAAVRRVMAEIAAKGPVYGLVNNAGVHIAGPAASFSVADFDKTMALNATAVMVAAREVFPHLEAEGGVIVNIGSFFDKIGAPGNLAYCASKAAVAAMTRVMAVEWARHGIKVINVAPGYIETDLNRDYLAREKVQAWMKSRIPTGKPGHVSDVAKLVGALFAEQIPFFTGETIYIDGGQGMNH